MIYIWGNISFIILISAISHFIGLFELDKETFNELFSGYVLDAEPINDRGVKVSLAQMKSLVGLLSF